MPDQIHNKFSINKILIWAYKCSDRWCILYINAEKVHTFSQLFWSVVRIYYDKIYFHFIHGNSDVGYVTLLPSSVDAIAFHDFHCVMVYIFNTWNCCIAQIFAIINKFCFKTWPTFAVETEKIIAATEQKSSIDPFSIIWQGDNEKDRSRKSDRVQKISNGLTETWPIDSLI